MVRLSLRPIGLSPREKEGLPPESEERLSLEVKSVSGEEGVERPLRRLHMRFLSREKETPRKPEAALLEEREAGKTRLFPRKEGPQREEELWALAGGRKRRRGCANRAQIEAAVKPGIQGVCGSRDLSLLVKKVREILPQCSEDLCCQALAECDEEVTQAVEVLLGPSRTPPKAKDKVAGARERDAEVGYCSAGSVPSGHSSGVCNLYCQGQEEASFRADRRAAPQAATSPPNEGFRADQRAAPQAPPNAGNARRGLKRLKRTLREAGKLEDRIKAGEKAGKLQMRELELRWEANDGVAEKDREGERLAVQKSSPRGGKRGFLFPQEEAEGEGRLSSENKDASSTRRDQKAPSLLGRQPPAAVLLKEKPGAGGETSSAPKVGASRERIEEENDGDDLALFLRPGCQLLWPTTLAGGGCFLERVGKADGKGRLLVWKESPEGRVSYRTGGGTTKYGQGGRLVAAEDLGPSALSRSASSRLKGAILRLASDRLYLGIPLAQLQESGTRDMGIWDLGLQRGQRPKKAGWSLGLVLWAPISRNGSFDRTRPLEGWLTHSFLGGDLRSLQALWEGEASLRAFFDRLRDASPSQKEEERGPATEGYTLQKAAEAAMSLISRGRSRKLGGIRAAGADRLDQLAGFSPRSILDRRTGTTSGAGATAAYEPHPRNPEVITRPPARVPSKGIPLEYDAACGIDRIE